MSVKIGSIEFPGESVRSYEAMGRRLLGADLVLMLLYISPVKGATKLQKQVFLAWKTLFKRQAVDPGFFPYRFGAYSSALEDSLRILDGQGFIEVRPAKDEGRLYTITDSGRRRIEKKLKDLKIDLNGLRREKKNWDEWTTKGIMRFVYRNYPEYTVKSEVPSLKW